MRKDDPKVQEFIKNYKAEYGIRADQIAAQAYNALYIYAEALRNAGEADRDAFRDALAEINGFEGISEYSHVMKKAIVEMTPVLAIKDGKFQLFE